MTSQIKVQGLKELVIAAAAVVITMTSFGANAGGVRPPPRGPTVVPRPPLVLTPPPPVLVVPPCKRAGSGVTKC